MPQAPLPALAARLAPQNLITPMHAGQSTPLDVLAHQQMVDYMSSLQKGVQVGHELSKLPTEGQEQVLQRAHIQLAKEKAKALQDQVNEINKRYAALPSTPENLAAKANELNNAYLMSGEEQLQTGQYAQRPTMPVGAYGAEGYRYQTARPNEPAAPAPKTGGTPPAPAQQNGSQNNPPPDPVQDRLKRWIYRGSSTDVNNPGDTNLVSNANFGGDNQNGVMPASFLNLGYNPALYNPAYPAASFG